MNPQRHPLPGQAARGFSLIAILLMTAVLALLALGAMNSSVMQERMAGNARDRQVALQAAEAALRDAELDIENNITNATVFTDACTSGLCIPPSINASGATSTPVWQTLNWTTNSRAYGQGTAAPALLGPGNAALATQPRYVIEVLPTLPPRAGYESACVGGGCTNVAVERARAYRITVRASGIRPATEVMLQSVYVKQ